MMRQSNEYQKEFMETPMLFDNLLCFHIFHSKRHDFYLKSLMLIWKNIFDL